MVLNDNFKRKFQDLYFDAISVTFKREKEEGKKFDIDLLGSKAFLVLEENLICTKCDKTLELNRFYTATIDGKDVKVKVKDALGDPYVVTLEVNGEDCSFNCKKYRIEIA